MKCEARVVLGGVIVAVLAVGVVAHADDWNNKGGNASRNGLCSAQGPTSATPAWTAPDSTIISWNVVVSEGRVFTIKEWGFPGASPVPTDEIVARRLSDGGLLWRKSLPYGGNNGTQWIGWIAGARDGRVYASRSTASGPSGAAGSPQPITAYAGATGALVWNSADTTVCGPYDGVVFAPNGDLIVGDRLNVTRIRATDGGTEWRFARTGSVSGNCGAAVAGNGVYIADVAVGGHRIEKYDLTTGAFLYQSAVMPGFTLQNTPFISPDGQTVYLARTQNSPTVDFLYAWHDTGSGFAPRWNRPVRWTTGHEHGVSADGSIYTFLAGNEFVRLDPATGTVTASAGVLSPPTGSDNLSPQTAVDASGRVYVANGWAGTPSSGGRLWAFPPDLSSALFTLTLTNPNVGGPALAQDGTLISADLAGVHAWRTAPCTGDFNQDGVVDGADLGQLLGDWGTAGQPAGTDLDHNGLVDGADLGTLLGAWGACALP